MFFEHYDDAQTRGLISGNRFSVIYRLYGDEQSARSKAADICTEQSVEFPVRFLPPEAIPEMVVGRIEKFEQEAPERYLATISFADEIAAGEFTQFLNVVFGNISIKRGIQVAGLLPSKGIFGFLSGPRFGIPGLRALVEVRERPLFFTALKPMGLSAADMASLAGLFVEGGVDVIKDDHGLTNQVFAPFEERVQRCSAAVREGNAKFGRNAIYVPNITAPTEQRRDRAFRARELGAGGLLISAGLTSIDVMRSLADAGIDLPLFVHPAFIGSYVLNPAGGIAADVFFGMLMRMAGADATIFPNYGGRFPLSRAECLGIARACKEPLSSFKPIFPSPTGGMELANINEMAQSYGKDLLILVGGGLFSSGPDIVSNCRRFLTEIGTVCNNLL
jgi:ribulose-bisphosphate carboxylase large chain